MWFSSQAAETNEQMQEFVLRNGYTAYFDASSCQFKLYRECFDEIGALCEVFKSDKRLLQVGKGNVDDIPIMIDGNVPEFPKVSSRSDSITCNQPIVTDN